MASVESKQCEYQKECRFYLLVVSARKRCRDYWDKTSRKTIQKRKRKDE